MQACKRPAEVTDAGCVVRRHHRRPRPARPVTILPLGRRHRRWERATLPGETVDELERPETAWRLLAEWGVTADDAQIVRRLVCAFEARPAHRWREGRVFLMGDACRTVPPLMGQGLCPGIRDARSLAWKPDLVPGDAAAGSILDSHEAEREPHARAWTVISLEAGEVPCTLDVEVARRRDGMFRNGWKPPMPDFPEIDAGLARPEPAGGSDATDLARERHSALFDVARQASHRRLEEASP